MQRVAVAGGTEVAMVQVGLLSRGGFLNLEISTDPFCGGTLVNSRHVVTAAHCINDKEAGGMAVTVREEVRVMTTNTRWETTTSRIRSPSKRWVVSGVSSLKIP